MEWGEGWWSPHNSRLVLWDSTIKAGRVTSYLWNSCLAGGSQLHRSSPEGLAKRLHSSHQLLISCPCRFTFCRSTKQTRWADMLAKSRKTKTIIREGHDTAKTLLAEHSTHHTPVLLLSPRGIVRRETQASSAAARGSHLPGTMYRLLLSPINPSINQSSG